MKQLIYMCSCYYKPRLTEPDLFSSGPLNYFLLFPNVSIAVEKNASIKKYAILVINFLFSIMTLFTQRRITGVVTTQKKIDADPV